MVLLQSFKDTNLRRTVWEDQMSEPLLSVIYVEGRLAFADGRLRDVNPHKKDLPEARKAWDDGWLEAEKEALSGRELRR